MFTYIWLGKYWIKMSCIIVSKTTSNFQREMWVVVFGEVLWNCSAFLWLACLRDEWMIDHDSSPLWQWVVKVSTRELSDGSPETFMGTQLLWISIMHKIHYLVMYERESFLSQIISKPFSKYYTFHEIYHLKPRQWPVWCMQEFHSHTKGKQARKIHERISLCRENGEGDQSNWKYTFRQSTYDINRQTDRHEKFQSRQ